MKLSIKLLLVFLLISFSCISQSVAQRNTDAVQTQDIVLSGGPQKVDTKAHYLFYLHGLIAEAGNTRPTSPKFGVYEYEQILDTFKQSGFIVISEARKKNPENAAYRVGIGRKRETVTFLKTSLAKL